MVVDNLVGSHGSQWANFSSGIRVIRSKRVEGSAIFQTLSRERSYCWARLVIEIGRNVGLEAKNFFN